MWPGAYQSLAIDQGKNVIAVPTTCPETKQASTLRQTPREEERLLAHPCDSGSLRRGRVLRALSHVAPRATRSTYSLLSPPSSHYANWNSCTSPYSFPTCEGFGHRRVVKARTFGSSLRLGQTSWSNPNHVHPVNPVVYLALLVCISKTNLADLVWHDVLSGRFEYQLD